MPGRQTRAQAAANSESDKDAQLAKAWQGCSTLPYAAGSLDIPASDPLGIFYTPQSMPNSSAVVPGLVTFPLQQAAGATSTRRSALHGLLKAAAPSPFGKDKNTVYDPSVRSAAELKASQLGINKLLPPPEVGWEVSETQSAHCSQAVNAWRAVKPFIVYPTGHTYMMVTVCAGILDKAAPADSIQ